VSPTISVVIPVHQAAAMLRACLQHLRDGSEPPFECIVVDDGSTDASAEVARSYGARVLATGARRGPAHARNKGVQAARGNVILFLDADVCPAPDTIARVREAFEKEPDLDALIGSYDDAPSSPGFVSQYKNLMHCFVHQSGRRAASTFWSGCGAIHRDVFLALGGFDEAYDRPAIEDIELGYRLVGARRKVRLDPHLTVKHLKHWTLTGLIRSDIFDRGVPWTELIWRDRLMPNDLNLRTSQRVSVALVVLLVALSGIAALGWDAGSSISLGLGVLGGWLLGLAAILLLNRRFYAFLAQRRGPAFACAAVPMQLAYYAYSGFSFAVGTFRFAAGLARERVVLLEAEGEPVPGKIVESRQVA